MKVMKKEKKTENKKKKGVFKVIKIILNTICVVLIAAFVLIVCLQRFSNNKLSFFNYRMFTVVSESMKPKYVIGDVLIAKEVEPSKIKVGDTISYLGKTGSMKDKVITHNVISVEQTKEGKYLFHAKGLANLVEDPKVYDDQIYGVVVYKSVILSLVYKVVGTKYGMFIFVIVPILYIIGSEIVSTMLEKEAKRREKLNKKKEKEVEEEKTEEK